MRQLITKYKDHHKSNLKLAIPVVISQLGHTLVHTADSIIVGHFAGTIQLAAVSLVNSVFTILMVVGIGISYGLTPLIAQHNGRGEHTECGKLLSNSLIINLVSSAVLFCFIYFGSAFFIDRLGQSPQVVFYAKPYLTLLGFSIIPLMVFNTFKQFAEGLGFTRQAMMISIWGNAINIILGIIFVKGLFGITPMGVSGVGLSTLIDRLLMATVMGIYVLRSKNFKIYLQQFSWSFIDKVRSAKILKIGAPVAMQYAFELTAFSGAAILMGTLGAVEQASHQVAINMAAITYMMASGVSAAAAIKSGNYFGNKNFADLKSSAISNYQIILFFMSCTALIFVVFHKFLPYIYTSDKDVVIIAAELLLIAAIFQLFDGAQVVGLGILRGIGDVNIPTLITFIAYWLIGLPVAYFIGIYMGVGATGIWYGLTLGLLVSAGLLYIRFITHIKRLSA